MIKYRTGILLVISIGVLFLLWRTQFQRSKPVASVKVSRKYQPQAGPVPRFVTYHLAEVHLTSDDKWPKGIEYTGLYDFESNYCIKSGDGPDGCEYILQLGPSSDWGFGDTSAESIKELREIFRGVRLKLVTGRGVAIGDTPQEVERKIGKPITVNNRNTQDSRGKPHQNLEYIYTYRGKKLYLAKYNFEDSRLTRISFRAARPPGEFTGPNGGCP